MHPLIAVLKKYISNITDKLNISTGQTLETMKQIEEELQINLPQSFLNLYKEYDGECQSYDIDEPIAAILGFNFLTSEQILKEILIFKDLNEIAPISMNEAKIKEVPLSEMKLVPFAFDSGRCYIALDMNPDEKGTIGQVIGIDYEWDKYYLIANSFESFIDFIKEMMSNKKCIPVENENDFDFHFEFASGHFFNDIEEILLTTGNSEEIELPDNFWQEYYENKIINNKIKTSLLQKESRLFIKQQTVSLKPLSHCENLRELIIHNSTIEDFEYILGANKLKVIYLIECTFTEDAYNYLSKLPNLTELHLGICTLPDISTLKDSNSIKSLSFRKCHNLDLIQLADMKKLNEIELEDCNIISLYPLVKMKKLKNLSLNTISNLDLTEILKELPKLQTLKLSHVILNNLDFLYYMKSLKEFSYFKKLENEEGLKALPNMKNLKCFEYPVIDMSIYSQCNNIKKLGFHENAKNFETLKEDLSCDIMILYKNRNDDDRIFDFMDQKADEIKKYINVTGVSATSQE